jgi:acyl-CoA thioester hydrolase
MAAVAAVDPTTTDCNQVALLPVHVDDLDPIGMLRDARYALRIERALPTFCRHHGHTFRDGRPATPDKCNVVKQSCISYRTLIRGTDDVVVHFWLEHIGRSRGVYDCCLLSPDGATVFAEGRRVVIRLDQETLRPTPWTPRTRAVPQRLLRRPGPAQSRRQTSRVE